MFLRLSAGVLIVLAAAGCAARSPITRTAAVLPSASASPSPSSVSTAAVASALPVALVNPQYALGVAGQEGWMYHKEEVADLDGDGTEEKVVIIANADVVNGEPLWDDGQVWQVYVEEPSGERTYIFSNLIQLGALDGMITVKDPQDHTVVLVQRGGTSIGVFEITYQAPNTVQATTLLNTSVYRHLVEAGATDRSSPAQRTTN